MLISLPTGKTVDIPIENYLRMGKESYQLLIANNVGGYVEHPFYGSALYNKFDDDDFLAYKAGYSLREIGIFLNGRDHSTIIHNIEKAKDHLETEEEFQKLFHQVENKLLEIYWKRINN